MILILFHLFNCIDSFPILQLCETKIIDHPLQIASGLLSRLRRGKWSNARRHCQTQPGTPHIHVSAHMQSVRRIVFAQSAISGASGGAQQGAGVEVHVQSLWR